MHPSLEQGGPNASLSKYTKSEWMIEELFYTWLVHFAEHRIPSIEDPVPLILDNHIIISHISIRIFDFCCKSGIIMLAIRPHKLHRTQPLYLTVHSTQLCMKNVIPYHYERLTPLQLIPLFTQVYLNDANPEKAVRRFRVAGFWPFIPNVFGQLIQKGDENPPDRISAE